MDNIFYVYALLDPRKPGIYKYGEIEFNFEPFYIGKGKGRRCYVHFRESSLKEKSYKNNKIKKIIKETNTNPNIFKIYENLFEEVSLETEKFLIKQIGRNDVKKGPLLNKTDGGEGFEGISDETKIKLREGRLGEKNHFFGKRHTEETKRKISEAKLKQGKEISKRMSGKNHPLYGKSPSNETRKKISDGLKGEKHYLYGKHIPEESKRKMSEIKMGEKHHYYGKHFSEEHKNKISKSKLGEKHHYYGKKLSKEHREKISKSIRERNENKKLEKYYENNWILDWGSNLLII